MSARIGGTGGVIETGDVSIAPDEVRILWKRYHDETVPGASLEAVERSWVCRQLLMPCQYSGM